VEASTQNPIPIAVLLTLAAFFLYLHFSNGSGFTRLMLAAGLVVASVLLLLPSFKLPLPAYFDTMPKIQLGLDLQGGTHLMLEVKLQDAINNALKRRAEDLSRAMTDSKLDAPTISRPPDGSVVVKLKNPAVRTAFLSLIDKSFPDVVLATAEDAGDGAYSLSFRERDAIQLRNNAIDQALETIRNRIDQLGVRETVVQKEGDNDILVQLPGIQDPERAKELIGKTAVLEFKFLDDKNNVSDATKNGPPPGDEVLSGPAQAGGSLYLVESDDANDRGRRDRCARASWHPPRGSIRRGQAR
jgi:preprotein translocase subunit SecD